MWQSPATGRQSGCAHLAFAQGSGYKDGRRSSFHLINQAHNKKGVTLWPENSS
jgi:hypothetical protein